jgi:hypothetical protein
MGNISAGKTTQCTLAERRHPLKNDGFFRPVTGIGVTLSVKRAEFSLQHLTNFTNRGESTKSLT